MLAARLSAIGNLLLLNFIQPKFIFRSEFIQPHPAITWINRDKQSLKPDYGRIRKMQTNRKFTTKIAATTLALGAALFLTTLSTGQAEAAGNHNGNFKCFSYNGQRLAGKYNRRQASLIEQAGGQCHRKGHNRPTAFPNPEYVQPRPAQPIWNGDGYDREHIYQNPSHNQPVYNQPAYGTPTWGQQTWGQPTWEQPAYSPPPTPAPQYHSQPGGDIGLAIQAAKSRYKKLRRARFIGVENSKHSGFKYKKFTLVFKKRGKIKKVRVKANTWSGKIKWVSALN
jgi:hypothetical protein